MTALLSWDIHTGVSVIACYLYGFENCPDFQCQITECLTLIFNMSAMQTRRCALHAQSYEKSVKHTSTMTVFFYLYALFFTILHVSAYMI